MTPHNNVMLDFAFVLACIATIFNIGYTAQPGTSFWQGRFYFHFGWAAIALWIASIIF